MGTRLHTWELGSGPPLIVQGPAWGPSSEYLRATLAPLLKGFRVVGFDPRNVGRSQSVDGADAQAVDNLVDDLEGLRVELGFDEFVLVGHSHGGFISMAYAVRHGRRLRGLVLLNTALRSDAVDSTVASILEEWAQDPRRRAAVDLFRRTGGRPRGVATDAELARQMRTLLPAYFFDLQAMRDFARAARGAPPPSSAALARMPPLPEPWVEEGLGTVDVETLVITGAFDVATPPSAGRHIGERLLRARLEVVDRSGHHPWVERPEAFVRVVGEFLKAL